MQTIVAIGGGGVFDYKITSETFKFDKEIVNLTNKKDPKALFIPTASEHKESYCQSFRKVYGKKLGCKTDVLFLIKDKLTKREIKKKILNSDLIYVGGGNTLNMMKIWRKTGVDKFLKQAYKKRIVLSGLSAGSICWFKSGLSDSIPGKWINVKGLGLINAINCSHYSNEKGRKSNFKKLMKKSNDVGIAIDNCCAIKFIEDKYQVIASKKDAKAYKVFYSKNKFHHEVIEQRKKLTPITSLFKK